MAYVFDLFSHPHALHDAKKEIRLLNEQIKLIEGLEHAKARLEARASLDSNTLSKCDIFVHYINNSAPDSRFHLEVCKLNWGELVFSSISFERRRLDSVLHRFTASDIRAYVTASRISCLDRKEILVRLKHLSDKSQGRPFSTIYANAARNLDDDMPPDPKPITKAEEAGAFNYRSAGWKNVEDVFGTQMTEAVRHTPQPTVPSDLTECVRGQFPRDWGDAIIRLDLGSDGKLALLCGSGAGIRTSRLREVFGETMADAIEESDLRKWEKRNGHTFKTDCVKIVRYVELRIRQDKEIANMLFN